MTKHLPDAQRDMFAVSGVIVIDGECLNCGRTECQPVNGILPLLCRGVARQTRAPEEWRTLTGDRVATFTATCPTCDGEGLTMGYGRTHSCERCGGTGVVSLGKFTIPPLLPVWGREDRSNDHRATPHICIADGFAIVYNSDGRQECEPLPLSPLPEPGQFVAKPSVAMDAETGGRWWVIHEADLRHMLERVEAGERPSLVFAEHYANCRHIGGMSE